VQHARFDQKDPMVTLDVIPNGRRVRCVIEDNSTGFPLSERLEFQKQALKPFPERGMGLLMLKAATEYFEYSEFENGCQRLEFIVSADSDPCLNIPF
jgi:anti-sigma regulatory factor (Ser/Thr protein kinase)